MKKIIVVTSSPRKGGNSETLAQKFAEGARAAGNDVQFVAVRDLGLKFCTGCMYCSTHDKCVLDDGMNALYEKFQNADVLVFATPVYYYAVCGQLKTFLDRLNPLYPRENKFKDVYLLATAAEDEESAMDGAVKDIQGWIDCFEGVCLKGVIRGIGVTDKGEINNTAFPEKAYELGKNA
ncbi:MAG: flavodoxin family protein [Clostridia bacterium]|nr:flavodoxin family protein [Clostridia bacterium]